MAEPYVSRDVLAAVRPGWVVAPRQAAFIRAVEDLADEELVRCDGRRNLLVIAWVYARCLSHPAVSDMTTRPSRARVVRLTGLSEATVKRWTCWMVHHGALGLVECGRTADFRPMALQAEGGRVSVYVLCVRLSRGAGTVVQDDPEPAAPWTGDEGEAIAEPAGPVDKSDPSGLLLLSPKNPYPRAREIQTAITPNTPLRGGEQRSDKNGQAIWPRTAVAGSGSERLNLVERLRAEAPALRPMSSTALRSLLRPWLERIEHGWDVRWLLHAIDHTPAGEPRTWTTAVRVPAGWLRFRMSAWLDEHGQPLPSPGVQLAAAEQARRAEAQQARDEQLALSAQLGDERAFGDLVRDVAGRQYPALVGAVLARTAGGRLLPAAAAEALTRQAVRELAAGAGQGVAAEDAVETAVVALLSPRDST